MKRFENIFRTLRLAFLGLVVFFSTPLGAQPAAPADSIEIGLITCSPHEEVYSLYGHSALRYRNLRTGEDVVFNYGIFNFKKPHFVLRFVFGLTDYELGVAPTQPFCDYYRKWGSQVTEQVLNLTSEEKRRVVEALAENLRPENRVYRYNYFYDNCSTRPRDVIERCLSGTIDYAERTGDRPTYRQLIHDHTAGHPWARFGNDMLLGVKADMKTTMRQQEFLPEYLMADFDQATIVSADGGERRPLVSHKRTLVEAGVQTVEREFPLTPMQCAIVLLVVSCLIAFMEWRRKRTFRLWDALLMLLQGLSGCVIFVMFFSEHPTTSTNLLIFLLNPLPLFFLPSVVRRRPTRWWGELTVGIILFFIGAIWQDYAEGMEILALCLLLRILSHRYNDK